MTPDEADLAHRGLQIVAAHLRGDDQGKTTWMETFSPDVGRIADACTFVAILAGTTLSMTGAGNLSKVLAAAEPVDAVLVPGISYDRAGAIALAVAVSPGNDTATAQAASGFDVPTAINSAFNLAVGVTLSLADTTSRPVAVWLDTFIEGAKREL
jgi:hypothetical protein